MLGELNRPIMGYPKNIVRKYDTDGNEIWTQEFGLPEGYARRIAIDNSGIYVAGHTSGTLPGQINSGGQDGFVLKFGFDGVQIWAKQFGSSAADTMHGVALTDSGVYVAGETGDSYKDAVVLKLTKEAISLSFLYLPVINH